MWGRSIVVAALAGGAVLAAQTTGFAEETTTPTPTTTPTSKPNEPYPFLSVSLAPVKPGGDVLVSVGCAAGELGTVKSMALDVGPFEVVTEQPKLIVDAVAHVHPDLRNGFYQVSAVCGKVTLKTNFEVVGAKPKPTTPATTTKKPQPRTGNQVSRIPVGAPQTGGGGAAE